MTKRILVVEDQEDLRGILRDLLAGSGYEMLEAPDGQAGVDKAKAEKPDLILMDIQMPVLDGLSAAREIRALEQALGLPRTRIIALSANALPDHIAEARAAGMDDHLAKPIRPEGLIAMLAASAHAKAA